MVYRLVNSTQNEQELALRLSRLLCQFIPDTASAIYAFDPTKGRLKYKAVFDNKINILISSKKELKEFDWSALPESFALCEKPKKRISIASLTVLSMAGTDAGSGFTMTTSPFAVAE